MSGDINDGSSAPADDAWFHIVLVGPRTAAEACAAALNEVPYPARVDGIRGECNSNVDVTDRGFIREMRRHVAWLEAEGRDGSHLIPETLGVVEVVALRSTDDRAVAAIAHRFGFWTRTRGWVKFRQDISHAPPAPASPVLPSLLEQFATMSVADQVSFLSRLGLGGDDL